MNARSFASFVLALGFYAAACGGSSKGTPTVTPAPTPTTALTAVAEPATEAVVPFTPVVEVLTPPPDIDISGWLIYRDDANGFELKYPPDATVKRNTAAVSWWVIDGVGTQFFISIASGTSLSGKYLFVTRRQLAGACFPSDPHDEHITLVRSPSAVFWKGGRDGAGLSHWIRADDYFAAHESSCLRLQAVFEGVDPGVSGRPTPREDDMSGAVFLAVMSTFRWLD